ncbi:MAG: hypothetical protein WCI55_08565 [Armatimonadota bacterium]
MKIQRCTDGIYELNCIANESLSGMEVVLGEFSNRKWYVNNPNPDIEGLFPAELFDWTDFRDSNNAIILGVSMCGDVEISDRSVLSETINLMSSEKTGRLMFYWDCDSLAIFFMGQYEAMLANFQISGLKVTPSKYASHCHAYGVSWE